MTHTVTLTGEQLAEIRSAIDSMDTWAASVVSGGLCAQCPARHESKQAEYWLHFTLAHRRLKQALVTAELAVVAPGRVIP